MSENIQDEYDEEEELIRQEADGSYLADGMTEVEDLEELLGIQFEEEDYETLNGFLIFHLERIPTEEEIVLYPMEVMIFKCCPWKIIL